MKQRNRLHNHWMNTGKPVDDQSNTFAELSHLQHRIPTPDMTEPIMDKLGYLRVEESRGRTMRRRRLLTKLSTAVLVFAVAGISFQVYSIHEQAQQAQQPTIHGGLPGIVAENSSRVENVSRAIKTLMTPVEMNHLDKTTDLEHPGVILQQQRPADRDSSVTRWAGLL